MIKKIIKHTLPLVDWILLILLWGSFIFATIKTGKVLVGWILVQTFATYVVIKAKMT